MNGSSIPADVAAGLRPPEYPRSLAYDLGWVARHSMGPNVLWLAESLSQVLPLVRGSRVLDLGCGTALSSIFLAREFDVRVWAVDLWVGASDNWQRVVEAGEQRRVFPVHAEAHDLPFARGFFDAVVSLDAYHYFGTDDLYLGQMARVLRPDGALGIVVPGLTAELDEVPDHLRPHWDWRFWSFHSPAWWRRHWLRTGLVEVVHADLVPDGWRHWLAWDRACDGPLRPWRATSPSVGPGPGEPGHASRPPEWRMLEADAGRTLGFSRVVARAR